MDPEVPHFRRCFYIGGRYQDLSLDSSKTAQVMIEQMYVEELRPLNLIKPLPVVLWHGMGQTGTGWVTTPDCRPGWALAFLSQGYTVYIVDSPERGRSAWQPDSSKLISIPAEYVEDFWTATKDNGQLWPQAELHTQWPGTGRRGDPSFDTFMASQVQSRKEYAVAEKLARELGSKLFEKIGPAILCTHSQGSAHGWVIADSVPNFVKAIIALEPVGPPFVNRIASALRKVNPKEVVRPYGITLTPISYDPPLSQGEEFATTTVRSPDSRFCDTLLQKAPPRRLSNLSGIRTVIVTSEAGYHAHYDHATVAYLKQAGVDVTWLNLPEVNVKGNGHFMFLEMNNMEVFGHIQNWLEKLNKT